MFALQRRLAVRVAQLDAVLPTASSNVRIQSEHCQRKEGLHARNETREIR